MSVAIKVDIPEGVFSALWKDPKEFAMELRLAAAVKWYEMGMVSQEQASAIAGLTRKEFIFSIGRFGVSPFQYSIEEIKEELVRE